MFRYKYNLKGEKIKRHVTRSRIYDVNMTRIEAAANEHDMDIWDFRSGLAQSNVEINSKILAQLAIYEPKTFESLVTVAKTKLTDERKGLEEILRPDQPGVVHKTGLVPNHSTYCTGSTKQADRWALERKVPSQKYIPPPIGWKITGQYPGKNLFRGEKHFWNQRPKGDDYKYLPDPARMDNGEVFPDTKQGKRYRYAFRRKLTDPKVYRKTPHFPSV